MLYTRKVFVEEEGAECHVLFDYEYEVMATEFSPPSKASIEVLDVWCDGVNITDDIPAYLHDEIVGTLFAMLEDE